MVEIHFDLTPEAISTANNIYCVLTDSIDDEDEQIISAKVDNASCLVDGQLVKSPFSIIANRIDDNIVYLIADLKGFSQVILPSEVDIHMHGFYLNHLEYNDFHSCNCDHLDGNCEDCTCEKCPFAEEGSDIETIDDLPAEEDPAEEISENTPGAEEAFNPS